MQFIVTFKHGTTKRTIDEYLVAASGFNLKLSGRYRNARQQEQIIFDVTDSVHFTVAPDGGNLYGFYSIEVVY